MGVNSLPKTVTRQGEGKGREEREIALTLISERRRPRLMTPTGFGALHSRVTLQDNNRRRWPNSIMIT